VPRPRLHGAGRLHHAGRARVLVAKAGRRVLLRRQPLLRGVVLEVPHRRHERQPRHLLDGGFQHRPAVRRFGRVPLVD
jgi:hypothetical protein